VPPGSWSRPTTRASPTAARAHGVDACLTRSDHPTGTDRLAEAAVALGLADDAIVVNVQGDEPLLAPALVARMAALLASRPDAAIATACHSIHDPAEAFNRTWSKLCSIVPASRSTSAVRRFPGRATRSPHPLRVGSPTACPRACRSTATTAFMLPRRLPAPVSDADAGTDRALRGAGAAACALARGADRRRGDRRHAGTRRRHAGGPRARAHALWRRSRVTRI